ncbi:CLUMA_CG013467, isoform A [Clunio marinus]|uniref:CLUMA_CG013467, isoform A n=1 Tax=Clunio marinus TaxID=568069 RepID=A0A1J1INY3_9DIPT|nr:CLUMA_CG013467, isoform A [Clunio marinus]
MAQHKMDRDEVLVKLVEHESIIWKRNHSHFKNVTLKEQAWGRVAYQLGISTTEAERRFKSIREKYRRRKILLERDSTNNVEHSKLKRWDLYNKLGFLDDFMIPRNGSESLGTISLKSESVSSENISSTNEVTIQAVPKIHTSTANLLKPQQIANLIIRPLMHINHQTTPQNISRSSQSTPSPSTTTANITNESTENNQFNPIVKMEVADDDTDNNVDETNVCMEQKFCENGNFNYVGDFISAELNKLPLRDAFMLKNILVREVLNFSDKVMLTTITEKH